MEDMSEAYLRALCAANGYSIVKVEHDKECQGTEQCHQKSIFV